MINVTGSKKTSSLLRQDWQYWFAPEDRTNRNFETLLARSQGFDFYATIVFSRHIWHGPAATRQNIVDALRYILDHHAVQPNFLRMNDKPMLFFTDMSRVPVSGGQTPPQFWDSVRNEVDPKQQSWWIAEGLDASYLSVFDGLFVFKITHADYPNDYLKSSLWAKLKCSQFVIEVDTMTDPSYH